MTFFARSVAALSFSLSLLPVASPASAAACGCPLVPLSGAYVGAEPMVLGFGTDTVDSCPSTLTLQAKRQGAPDANVVLSCEPGTGSFVGAEAMPFGQITYRLTPILQEDPARLTPAALQPKLARVTDVVQLDLTLPAQMKNMGKQDRSSTFSHAGGGKAPACQCGPTEAALDALKSGAVIQTSLVSVTGESCQSTASQTLSAAEECRPAVTVEAAFLLGQAQATQCQTLANGADFAGWIAQGSNQQMVAQTAAPAQQAWLADWVGRYCR